MKKVVKISALILLLICLTFAAISFYFAFDFISPNNCTIGNAPLSSGISFENVQFKTEDGLQIRGWYSKPDTGSKVIILLHGFKGSRVEGFEKCLMLKKYGYGVLLFDSRACGESEGDQISLGYYETMDLLAAIDFLKNRRIDHIGLIGFSQGGATITLAANKFPKEVKFVILESVFPTLRSAVDSRFMKYFGIPGFIGGFLMIPFAELMLTLDVDDISPYDNMKNLKIPVLVAVGEKDSRLKLKEALLLSEIANEPSEWAVIENAEHEDLFKGNKSDYEVKIIKFIKKYF